MREEKRREDAAIKIQSTIRMHIASKDRRMKQAQKKRINHAVVVIQCMFRKVKAKMVLAHLKWEKYNQMLNGKATKITRIWRGILDRRRVRQKKEDQKALLRKQQLAVMPVQACFRGKFSFFCKNEGNT